MKSGEPIPSTSQPTPVVQEQISKASNTDLDGTDKTPAEKEPPRQTLKVRLPLKLLKRSHQTTTSNSKDGVTPSKVRKEPEAEEAKAGTPTRPLEAALQKARFELFQKDLPEVQEVRAQIPKLQEGQVATQQLLDSSFTFRLRWAADEAHPPIIIGVHWIDHLEARAHLAKCKPADFKFGNEWLPLYTRAGVTRHVSSLSSLPKTQGDSPLIAVVPSDMLFQSDCEYVIHQLHKEECLSRVTLYYGKNLRKQIAFCSYCGVMNENTTTTYSHTRKHLGIMFLCGGCYTKLYKAPQHLLSPLSHEQAGGLSAECEEEVAKPSPPPPTHENLEVLLIWRPLACVCDRDPWSPLSETFGLPSVMFNFDFWRLSPHVFKCLIYFVTIYNKIN